METKDRDINFLPNTGFGEIRFDYDEDQVNRILGIPDERIVDSLDDSDYSVRLYYHNLKLSIYLHFENGVFNYMSIHTNSIILDGKELSVFTRDELLKTVKKHHDTNGIDYEIEVIKDDTVGEECISFDNIGLTIWFEENRITDICVNPVIE